MRIPAIIFALVASIVGVFMWGRFFLYVLQHPMDALVRLGLPLLGLLLLFWVIGKIRGPRAVDGSRTEPRSAPRQA